MMQDQPQTSGLTAQLCTSADTAEASPRKAERAHVDLDAGLRQRGASGVSVQVHDLSTHGFRASTHLHLYVGADVWLKISGLEALHARVAWTNGCLVGCEFVQPLHPAVMQMMVSR